MKQAEPEPVVKEVEPELGPKHEIVRHTSHIAPMLQMQLLTNPGYLFSLALKCKRDEEQIFDRLIENKRAILPGVAFC